MRLILVLGLAGFASSLSLRSTDPLLPLLAEDFGTSVSAVAVLVSVYTLPYSLMQLVFGPVADAVGKARLIRACTLVVTAALLASAVAPTWRTLELARAVAGGFAGGLIPVSMALIGDRVPLEGRQVAISRFLMAVIFGQLAGAAGAGTLGHLLGWRGVYALAGGVAALAAVTTALLLRGGPFVPAALSLPGALARYRGVLANPRAARLVAVTALEGMLFFGVVPFLAPLLRERGAGGPFEAGLVITAFALGGLGYTAAVRWLLRVLGPPRLMALGGIAGGAAVAATALPLPWPAVALLFTAAGAGFYMLHNCLQTIATELSASARASALALFACAFFLGQAGGVLIAREGAARLGLPAVYALAGALITLLGLLAATQLGNPRPRPAPEPR